MHAENQLTREPGDLLGVWVARLRSVREGQDRTTDVNAQEKSDCAIVPVNQPNKEDPYSAEVGEERARTKENIVRIPHDPDSERALFVTQGLSGVRHVVSPPFIRGRSRMRELRSSGSVRGVPGDRHSYREVRRDKPVGWCE